MVRPSLAAYGPDRLHIADRLSPEMLTRHSLRPSWLFGRAELGSSELWQKVQLRRQSQVDLASDRSLEREAAPPIRRNQSVRHGEKKKKTFLAE